MRGSTSGDTATLKSPGHKTPEATTVPVQTDTAPTCFIFGDAGARHPGMMRSARNQLPGRNPCLFLCRHCSLSVVVEGIQLCLHCDCVHAKCSKEREYGRKGFQAAERGVWVSEATKWSHRWDPRSRFGDHLLDPSWFLGVKISRWKGYPRNNGAGGGKETENWGGPECGEVAVPSEEERVPDHIRIAKFPRTRWRRALRCRAMGAFYIFQFDSASSLMTRLQPTSQMSTPTVFPSPNRIFGQLNCNLGHT